MTRIRPGRPPAAVSATVLAAALAVELIDELVDGTKGAALPLMRHDLGLSYTQLGLLVSVPVLIGSFAELPMGLLAGYGRRQRIAVLAGGGLFAAALAATALSWSFAGLLIAMTVFFPASGAFVGLTQSGLMAAEPARQEQLMARWNLAGSAGAVAGPLLLIAVLAAGGSWRVAYLLLAAAALAAWAVLARSGRALIASPPEGPGEPGGAGWSAGLREAAAAVRQGEVARLLVLIEVADYLLDVLTGFLAVYLVDVVHATAGQAALGVTVRLVAGLAGDLLLVLVLERVSGLAVLRAAAAAALLLYPAFLLVPGLWAKLVLLAALSMVTAPLYPVLQARLYAALPGRSGVAVTLSSAAALAAAVGPLAVGVVAQRLGLGWAMASLALAAPVLLAGLARRG
ncbi:MAG TPA: MFS transporter [Streptosporangiaceae bacterium]|nr:MFS transporter [Streptosporangiaceae bacterium]